MNPRAIHGSARQSGVATVEFALVCVLFFTVLFAVIDFSYLAWVTLTMQHAVREGSRLAVTGRQDLDPTPQPDNTMQNRFDSAVVRMSEQSMGLWPKVSPVVTVQSVSDAGVLSTLPPNSLGAASSIVVITVDCSVVPLTPLIAAFFPGGRYHFRVNATMRNEAFS